ncbi:uncharacterized protein LOC132272518 [Cornus florida]|uniref:uncharacterized protein LOC132272518 n=1 Tax=Cornus florida TaxID=4283 RepID=UPI00289B92DE|nr:uncharacterized protein LOC132272518 [Cornus florida]
MNSELFKDGLVKELYQAISGMGFFKAPGPDGFTPPFFESNWEMVKDDLLTGFNYFLHGDQMLRCLNATNLVLIPKSAFVPNRLIHENIVIAHDLMHVIKSRKKSTSPGLLAIKLDMAKAYDRVDLIMNCVQTVPFSMVINGDCGARFAPFWGLRQGDPISPYLFLFCTEGLTTLIHDAIRQKKLTDFKMGRGCLPIS